MNDRLKRYIAPYTSLKLTVALLGMSTFLVFAGTLAQVDKGIWTVMEQYFRCAFAWIEFRVFFPRDWNVPGGIWFPGGWFLGGLLFVNVVSAHLVRFKVYATGGRLVAGLLVLALGGLLTWLVIAGVFNSDIAATESAAFWRVLLRLAKGGGVALVLMVGCVLAFKRRAGIVLLHSGIILLLISEFVTGAYAQEGQMRINAGESVNFVEHMRSVELAFIDRSDPETDHVTVIPRGRLRAGGVIRDDQLPVDVELIRYMTNSRLVDGRSGTVANPATAGSGLQAVAIEEPEVSGTDQEQTLDLPAVYVTLRHKGTDEPIGSYLATPWLKGSMLEQQVFQVDGRPYEITLRFARTYKPYEIELLEFRHDKYVGTETPKNFSSLVRLVEKDKGVDRVVKIWMNNPLRYAGETFYQSSFEPGKNLTILQVVRNGGWMIPYLSCMIVGVGMTAHMGLMLFEFLRRRMTR